MGRQHRHPAEDPPGIAAHEVVGADDQRRGALLLADLRQQLQHRCIGIRRAPQAAGQGDAGRQGHAHHHRRRRPRLQIGAQAVGVGLGAAQDRQHHRRIEQQALIPAVLDAGGAADQDHQAEHRRHRQRQPAEQPLARVGGRLDRPTDQHQPEQPQGGEKAHGVEGGAAQPLQGGQGQPRARLQFLGAAEGQLQIAQHPHQVGGQQKGEHAQGDQEPGVQQPSPEARQAQAREQRSQQEHGEGVFAEQPTGAGGAHQGVVERAGFSFQLQQQQQRERGQRRGQHRVGEIALRLPGELGNQRQPHHADPLLRPPELQLPADQQQGGRQAAEDGGLEQQQGPQGRPGEGQQQLGDPGVEGRLRAVAPLPGLTAHQFRRLVRVGGAGEQLGGEGVEQEPAAAQQPQLADAGEFGLGSRLGLRHVATAAACRGGL